MLCILTVDGLNFFWNGNSYTIFLKVNRDRREFMNLWQQVSLKVSEKFVPDAVLIQTRIPPQH